MDGLTLSDIVTNGDLLAWPVVVYLFNEVQKLHRQRHDDMKAQLDMFQKVALRASEGGD